jgi:acyl-CoA thioesterase-2
MDERLEELVRLLSLERLENDLFRGESRDIGSPQVFGGQVLGQALRAAYATVPPERAVHSLHAYFLRRGDFNAPIVYFVDRSRDGESFTSRRVTAIQHGEQIFNLSASFQKSEQGIEHQAAPPDVPPPEALHDSRALPAEILHKIPERARRFLELSRPFEFRPVHARDWLSPEPLPPSQQVWMRAVDRLPDDDALHRSLLAYVSDYNLLNTALRPHPIAPFTGSVIMASIDHAMWFHRPLRVDDWLLYDMSSPSASGARGFATGRLYTRAGVLVASMAQEGLIRLVAAPPLPTDAGSGAGR